MVCLYFYIFSTGKTALDVLKVFLKVFFGSDKEHRREKKVLPNYDQQLCGTFADSD